MLDYIANLLGESNYNNKQFLQQFSCIADTITDEYVTETIQFVRATGHYPSFEELMDKVKALNNELLLKAAWCRDTYKEELGRRSPKLSHGCRKIIKRSVSDFIRRVKTTVVIHSRFDMHELTAD